MLVPIEFHNLKRGTGLYPSLAMRENSVEYDEPAIMVMTDFKHITPFSVSSDTDLEAALEKMKACGVRLLFVTNRGNEVEGLITADDILGEKPVNYLRERPGSRDELIVADIMTRWEQLDAVSLLEVSEASVGDIVDAMLETHKHHILVVDRIQGRDYVRGLFSKTQVGRQIGQEIDFSQRASNFMELEMALSPL